MSTAVDPLNERLEGRPSWQISAIVVGIVGLSLMTIVIVSAIASITAPYSPLSGQLHQAVIGLPVVLGIYETMRRIARLPPSSLLADWPGYSASHWAVIGLVLPTAVLGLHLWVFGATRTGDLPGFEPVIGALVASLGAGLLAGIIEELSFRGALLRVVETRWGTRTAVGVTAIGFAVLHYGHAHGEIELLLVFTSMLSAGILLGVIAVRTRNVWNAVAVHAGWNTVFGGSFVTAAPTEQPMEPALFQFHLLTGSSWLTGGGASLGAAPLTAVCLVFTAIAVAFGPDQWLCPPGCPRRASSTEDQ